MVAHVATTSLTVAAHFAAIASLFAAQLAPFFSALTTKLTALSSVFAALPHPVSSVAPITSFDALAVSIRGTNRLVGHGDSGSEDEGESETTND
jgi:hypothetical protein